MKANKNKLIPDLRFPEFKNDGEWKQEVLENITSAIFDGTHQTPTYTESGIPFFSVENIISGSKNKFISKKDYLIETAVNKPEQGDILITRIGNIGFSVLIDWDYDFSIYVTLACIKQSANFNSQYLHSFFQSDTYQKEILSKSLLNAAPRKINMNELRGTRVLLPNTLEQQKIASCLSSLDKIITSQTEKLELLQNHKKGLMQNLFPQDGEKVPKFRFPEFLEDGYWKRKILEELFKIGNGRDYKHLNNGKIPVYGSGGYMISVDEYLYDGESVCIGRKGTIDKPMFLIGKFWTVDTLFYTHSFINCLPKFIHFIFQNINWRKHNEAGGVPSLSKSNIYKIEIYLPEVQEQQKIVSCLSSLDNLIAAQTEKIEQLKSHKKGLMQGLFPKII